MGAAVGEGIVAAARLAVLQDAPLVIFTASGGARMQEGAVSLMQMPRTVIATRMVKEAGLPFIAVLTDPTTGGVTASFAMLGDIHIAEPGALHRLRRGAGDRADGSRDAAGWVPAGRIPAPARHRRHGRAAGGDAGDAGAGVGAAAPGGGSLSRIEPIIARLHSLHPRLIDLTLDRLRRLLAELGHPERRLPPVIHIAGTNGKGSTAAFVRAIAEAAGLRVHVYTSPHLVRFNERFRVAGALVADEVLAATFETIERVNGGAPITVFEVITAAAFVLFADTPSDLCVLEVGLGGRGDATNVIVPRVCAITSISLDHREMLGDTLALIAAEKAGILKPGVPAVTGLQPDEALAALRAAGPLLERGRDWTIEQTGGGLRYEDAAGGLDLPMPSLAGAHQVDNAGIAVAALRAGGFGLPAAAFAGLARAEWPARLQRLTGAVAGWAPRHRVLLDGGHNPGGGAALAAYLAEAGPAHIVVGMKQAKDAPEFLGPLLPHAASLWAVSEPGQYQAQTVDAIIAASGGVARSGPTVAEALAGLPREPELVLICGSLYLAGEVLKLDGALPA